jgi:hypothetical protein
MGQGTSAREEAAEPAGLNPLGALETCRDPGKAEAPRPRVLVSRPEFFTEKASLMIVSLREALADNKEGLEPPLMLLSPRPIRSPEDARAQGARCAALIVLWEQRESQTLELTLPFPARVPLRGLVHRRLCEFGDHSEQATILYFTILGLTAVLKNDYTQAQYFLTAAKNIDVECLHLPGGGLPAQPAGDETPKGAARE